MAKAIRQTRRVIGAFLEIWAIASLLRFLPAVTGDTTVSGRIEVDSTFYAAQQPYALATDLIVSAGATLVIEPGVTVRSNGFSILIRGKVVANGTAENTVKFVGNGLEPKGGLHSENGVQGYLDLFFTEVTGYQKAIDLQGSGAMNIKNSIFTDNVIGITWYSPSTSISRSIFSHCDIAIKAGWSWDVKIDNSTFKDNRIAINSGYLSEVTRSYFLNNTDAAAWNIYGGTFRNNAFVENGVAFQTPSESVPINDNLFVDNRIGILFTETDEYERSLIKRNAFCGSKPEWYIRIESSSDIPAPENYWGSTDFALMHGYIYDARHLFTVGLLVADNVLDEQPAALWGADLYSCEPPADRSFQQAESSSFFGNATFTLANSPYTIANRRVLYSPFTLTIEAGVVVNFVDNGLLELRGQLRAHGEETAPIAFNSATWQGFIKDYYYVENYMNDARDGVVVTIAPKAAVWANFTTFSGFENAVSGYGPVYLEDCSFQNNGLALQVSAYPWYKTGMMSSTVTRTEFLNNTYGFWSSRRGSIVNSTFAKNEKAIYSPGELYVVGSTFTENNAAVDQEGYSIPRFESSSFINNSLALGTRAHSVGNLYLNNTVAVRFPDTYSTDSIQFVNNSFCGTTDWNIRTDDTTSENLSNNYWGTDNTSLIRGTVYDAYYQPGLGLIKVTPVLDAPVITLEECIPPDDRGFSPTGTGNILEDTNITMAEWNVNQNIIIYPDATLRISPGVTINFNGSGVLQVRGRFEAIGKPDNPITFNGSFSNALTIDASSKTANISLGFAEVYNGAAIMATSNSYSWQPRVKIFNSTFMGGESAFFFGWSFPFTIENSTFQNYSTAIGCEYSRGTIKNSVFENNTVAISGCDLSLDSSVLRENTVGIWEARGTMQNNALYNNSIALVMEDWSYATFLGNSIVQNEVGLQVTDKNNLWLSDNNICGNKQYNVEQTAATDTNMLGTWWGVADPGMASSSIRDTRTARNGSLGRVAIDPVLFSPSPTPFDLQELNEPCLAARQCSAALCSGHGILNAYSKCQCLSGWEGDDCQTCKETVIGNRCVRSAASIGNDCHACLVEPTYAWCVSSSTCIDSTALDNQCGSITTNSTFCGGDGSVVVQKARMDTLTTISFIFREPTDKMAKTLPKALFGKTFDCSWALDFASTQLLGARSFCFWESERAMKIQLGAKYLFRPFFDMIQLKADAIFSTSDPTLSNAADLITVDPPSSLSPPVPVIKAPQVVSTCDYLTIDAAASVDKSGSINPSWGCEVLVNDTSHPCPKNWDWYIKNAGLTFTLYPWDTAQVLNQYSSASDISLRFTLQLYNIFGICAPTAVTVKITKNPSLSLSLVGNPAVSARNPTTIWSMVSMQGCNQYWGTLFNYNWTWSNNLNSSFISPSNASLSLKARAFPTVSEGGWINLTVTDVYNKYAPATASLWVYLAAEPLQLSIDQDGGTLSAYRDLRLSVNGYDSMGAPSLGNFTVQCQYAQLDGTFAACGSSMASGSSNSNTTQVDNYRTRFTTTLLVPAEGLNPGYYKFTVDWKKPDNRTVVAVANVFIVADTSILPETRIDILKPAAGDYVPPSPGVAYYQFGPQTLSFTGYPFATGYKYNWSISARTADTPGTALSSSTGFNKPSLQISASALEVGTFYDVSLNVSGIVNGTNLQGKAALSFFVISPPYNGELEIVPSDGDTDTLFTFRTMGVMDSVGGLQYLFGYTNKGSQQEKLLSSAFAVDYSVSAYLPAGTHRIWCTVKNTLGIASNFTKDVTVTKAAPPQLDSVKDKLQQNVQNSAVIGSLIQSIGESLNTATMSAQEKANVTSLLVDTATSWISNAAASITSQEGVQNAAGVLTSALAGTANSTVSSDVLAKAKDAISNLASLGATLSGATSSGQSGLSDQAVTAGITPDTAVAVMQAIGMVQQAQTQTSPDQPDTPSSTEPDNRLAEAVDNLLAGLSKDLLVGQDPLVITGGSAVGVVMRGFGTMDPSFNPDPSDASTDETGATPTSDSNIGGTPTPSAAEVAKLAVNIPVPFTVDVKIDPPSAASNLSNPALVSDGVIDTRVQVWNANPITDPQTSVDSQVISLSFTNSSGNVIPVNETPEDSPVNIEIWLDSQATDSTACVWSSNEKGGNGADKGKKVGWQKDNCKLPKLLKTKVENGKTKYLYQCLCTHLTSFALGQAVDQSSPTTPVSNTPTASDATPTSSEEGSSSSTPTTAPSLVEKAENKTQTWAKGEETVVSVGGGVALKVSASSDSGVKIDMTVAPGPVSADTKPATKGVNTYWKFEATPGATFTADLTWTYDDATLATYGYSEDTLRWAVFKDGEWTPMQGTRLDKSTKTLIYTTNSFSEWTIVSDDSNTQGGSASKIGLAGIIGAVAGGTIGVVIVGVGLWVVLGCGGDEEGKVTPAHEHKA